MNFFPAKRTGNNLHRSGAVIPSMPRPGCASCHSRPVGNIEACQANTRLSVIGSSNFWVASSIISTTPSTSRSAGTRPAISIPKRRAIEERTWAGSRISPSISLDVRDIPGKGLKDGFVPQRKAKAFHSSDQPTLPMPNGRQLIG